MKVLNEYSKVLTICEKRFFVNVIESACNFYITIKRAESEEVLANNQKFPKKLISFLPHLFVRKIPSSYHYEQLLHLPL